jgi:hypothetical protein
MARTRIRNIGETSGTITSGRPEFGVPITISSNHLYDRETAIDELGKHTDHAFQMERHVWDVSPLTGTFDAMPALYVSFDQYPPDYYVGIGGPGVPNMDGVLPPDAALRLIAQTNPSRPVFDLPRQVGELRDIPHLLRLAGRNMIDKGASTFLSYQFGWRPLINDLRSLFSLAPAVDRRIKELEGLSTNRGIHRRVTLGKGRRLVEDLDPVFVQSSGGFVACSHKVTCDVRQWGTIRWWPLFNPFSLPRSNHEKIHLTEVMLGLRPGQWGSAAWELLPWSWLGDWCGNLGDWLVANQNELHCAYSNVNVMTKYEAVHTYEVLPLLTEPWIAGGGATCKVTLLNRIVDPAPTVLARLPLLSATNLAVLGSLAIQRVPRNLLK